MTDDTPNASALQSENSGESCLRVLRDGPGAGPWNMAVDEALLEQPTVPALRLYRWSEPTLSLGYFQGWSDRPEAFSKLPTVRRPSGGGALLHDREQTYALVLPGPYWETPGLTRTVERVHEAIRQAIALSTSSSTPSTTTAESPLREAGVRTPRSADEPFLCYERRAEPDLLFQQSKIVGSAQRSRRGSLLQHGAILLEASPYTPHLPGLRDLGLPIDDERLGTLLVAEIAATFGLRPVSSDLSPSERKLAEIFERERHQHESWLRRR